AVKVARHVTVALEVQITFRSLRYFPRYDTVTIANALLSPILRDLQVSASHDLEVEALGHKCAPQMVRSERGIDAADADLRLREEPLHEAHGVSRALPPVRHNRCDPDLIRHPNLVSLEQVSHRSFPEVLLNVLKAESELVLVPMRVRQLRCICSE